MIPLLLFPLISAFVLSPYPIFSNPKLFSFCPGIDSRLKQIAREAAESTTPIVFKKHSSNTICSVETNEFYARTLTTSNFNTHIQVSNRLLSYDNTLFNTVLHELLHSLGLKHSPLAGIMNYSLLMESGRPLEDRRKLWLSKDDLDGLQFLMN